MNVLNQALSSKLMRLRVMMRRQYVTNHGKGFGMLLYGIHKKSDGHPMTITEISQEFSVTVAAATQMVKMFRRTGLVEVLKDPNDARIVRVILTPAGQTVVSQVEASMNMFMEEMTLHLGTEDTGRLNDILGKVLDYLSTREVDPQGEKTI